jgi:hypothetical protein
MAASVPLMPRPVVRLNGTTMVMVRFLAVKAIKRQLQAAGLRANHVEMRLITAQANDYVEQHRETLLIEATELIARVPELRKMSEREDRRRKLYQITPPKSARPTLAISTACRAAPAVPNSRRSDGR